MDNISQRIEGLLSEIDAQILQQQAQLRSQQLLEASIQKYQKVVDTKSAELDVVSNALALLTNVSDEVIQKNYRFIEENVNEALRRVFPDKVRQIRINEGMRGTFPQLEFKIVTDNGIERRIKADTGHGIAQIISIISLLCLIVIKGGRKLACFDEMTNGMSANTRALFDSVLWAFAEIGFQFILVDHGYIPRGAKVYVLKDTDGVGQVVKEYVEEKGVYNEGKRSGTDYSLVATALDEPDNNMKNINDTMGA